MNTVLQHITSITKPSTASLYVEKSDSATSYSGYFNCLYESQIRTITRITQVTFTAHCKGQGGIKIVRREKNGNETTIFHHEVLNSDVYVLNHNVTLSDGRLYIISDRDLEIQDAVWTTSETPVREVTLAIVICTFRKEQHIYKALQELLSSTAMSKISWHAFIIDNASELNNSIFLNDKITLIQQANVGGAGGFTRGIIEAQQRKFSHVLLMDDDIEINTESIFRTRQLFLYANDTICLGGPMLDLIKPTEMWESSACYDDKTCLRVHSNHHKFNLTNQENLDQLLSNEPVGTLGYCGWWYFSFPLISVEKCGLPLPCFIRGDDKEYGIRLTRSGVSSIPIMGTGVWHEPFYVKHTAWLWYFDVYNSLLIAALYEPWNVTRLVKDLHKIICRYILKLDYENAALRISAIEDLLLGATYFANTSAQERFKRCRDISNQYQPKRIEKNSNITNFRKPSFGTSILVSLTKKCFTHYWGKKILSVIGLRKKQYHTTHKQHSWRMGYISDEVIIHDEYTDYSLCYRYNQKTEYDLIVQLEICLTNLQKNWVQLCKDFQQGKKHFITTDFWRKYLNQK